MIKHKKIDQDFIDELCHAWCQLGRAAKSRDEKTYIYWGDRAVELTQDISLSWNKGFLEGVGKNSTGLTINNITELGECFSKAEFEHGLNVGKTLRDQLIQDGLIS